MVQFQSEYESLRTRRADSASSSLKANRLETQEELIFQFESKDRKSPISQLKVVRQAEFPLSLIEVSNWLDEDHTHQGGQSALPSLLIQLLISSRNNPIYIPRIMFDKMSGHPAAQSSWHIKFTIAYKLFAFLFYNLSQPSDTLQLWCWYMLMRLFFSPSIIWKEEGKMMFK